MIRDICELHGNLDAADIDLLEQYCAFLQTFSTFLECDYHVSIATIKKNEAIIIYHQRPHSNVSLYEEDIVGARIVKEDEAAVIRTLNTGVPSQNLSANPRGRLNIGQTVVPIVNAKQRVIAAITREMSEQTSAYRRMLQIDILENATPHLRGVLNRLNTDPEMISEYVSEAVLIFDPDEIVIYANKQAEQLYKKIGYLNYLLGMRLQNVVLDPQIYHEIKEHHSNFSTEVTIMDMVLSVHCIFLAGNETVSMLMLIDDITRARQNEKELVLRSVAMKETHHRVKNNLQTIASILRLQVYHTENPEVQHMLRENVDRILSIAATHEMLSEQNVDEDIELYRLVERIKNNLMMFYVPAGKHISIRIFGDELVLKSDVATNLALVVNELLSNAIEHAFPDRTEGQIEVEFRALPHLSQITIRDNGQGFVPSAELESLGLQIVKLTVEERLSGVLRIQSGSDGTSVVVELPHP